MAALAALLALPGWDAVLTRMARLFTKAALLTFGGANAVLPQVYQAAVEHVQWLTATQMIDGLVLGETTPGTLIRVVVFAGFVGGWTQALFGADALLLAGITAAVAGVIVNLAVFFAHHVPWPGRHGLAVHRLNAPRPAGPMRPAQPAEVDAVDAVAEAAFGRHGDAEGKTPQSVRTGVFQSWWALSDSNTRPTD